MSSQTMNMAAPAEVYRSRRTKLASKLNRTMVIAAGRARARHMPTMCHPFRAGSSYLYFGGPPVEGAALVIEPGSDGDQGCTLLRPVAGFAEAVWLGELPSDEWLADVSGLDVSRFAGPESLRDIVGGRSCGSITPPCPPTQEWVEGAGVDAANDDELLSVIDLRNIKDEHEKDAMRRSAAIAVRAHRAAMKAGLPGGTEARVAAAFHAELIAAECIPSFTPIISVRGEVLHSETYPNPLSHGDLLLVDAGAEEPGGYASDVTRTYPVDGKCSPIQRHLIDTVVRAMHAATAACVPGRRYLDVHDIAGRVICEGLVEAELLRGDPAELAARFAHTLFFTHGVGHLIGLDVHDMEDFGDLAGYAAGRSRRPEFGNKYLRLDRDLEPGMAITIEPGIYFVPALWRQEDMIRPFADVINMPAVDALIAGQFGGIRMEDTVLVTEAGCEPEVLSAELPTNPDEIAAFARQD